MTWEFIVDISPGKQNKHTKQFIVFVHNHTKTHVFPLSILQFKNGPLCLPNPVNRLKKVAFIPLAVSEGWT